MWGFNKGFLTWVARPASKVYRRVVIKPVRTGIGRMGKNWTYPDRLANNLLQGNWRGSCAETLRCLCNTVLGLGGFFDVATHFGVPKVTRILAKLSGNGAAAGVLSNAACWDQATSGMPLVWSGTLPRNRRPTSSPITLLVPDSRPITSVTPWRGLSVLASPKRIRIRYCNTHGASSTKTGRWTCV